MARRARLAGKRVFLFAEEHPSASVLVRALERADVEVDWVRSFGELRSRAAQTDANFPPVVFVAPWTTGSDPPQLLAALAIHSMGRGRVMERKIDRFHDAFIHYSSRRRLSRRQQRVLELYLDGHTDKDIARLCACSEGTVYEHWRRIARKAGGAHKGDAISDFHQFLGVLEAPNSEVVEGEA